MIATVESSDIEVVVDVGVPGTSEGVTGSLGGGGRLMRVGACDMVDVRAWTVEGVIYGVTDRHVRVVAI